MWDSTKRHGLRYNGIEEHGMSAARIENLAKPSMDESMKYIELI